MNQDLLKAALGAVNAIVEDEIKTEAPGHYFRAQKACALAAQLSNLGHNRVEKAIRNQRYGYGMNPGYDAPILGDDEMGEDAVEAALINPGAGLLQRAPGGGNMGMGDLLREMLGAFQNQIQLQNTPRPEKLLDSLLDVREKLRKQKLPVPDDLQARIDKLVAEVSRGDAPAVPALEEPLPVVDIDDGTTPATGPEDFQ